MTNSTLDKVVCVSLDTHIWTARKKLRPEDLPLAAGTLPPEEVASLGSKRVFDPKKIADVQQLKDCGLFCRQLFQVDIDLEAATHIAEIEELALSHISVRRDRPSLFPVSPLIPSVEP